MYFCEKECKYKANQFTNIVPLQSNNSRIQVKEFPQETHIEILPKIESWQLSAFTVWNGAWLLCGIVIVWQLFADNYPRDIKSVLFTYLAFWAFFQYKGIVYWFWKRYGRERIRIYADGLQYKKDVKGYGTVHTYAKENIDKFYRIEIKERSFSFSYQQSFWMPGNETLGFDYLGKTIGMGLQLNDTEIQELQKALKYNYQKKVLETPKEQH
jgi:hypothetical protein